MKKLIIVALVAIFFLPAISNAAVNANSSSLFFDDCMSKGHGVNFCSPLLFVLKGGNVTKNSCIAVYKSKGKSGAKVEGVCGWYFNNN